MKTVKSKCCTIKVRKLFNKNQSIGKVSKPYSEYHIIKQKNYAKPLTKPRYTP